MRVGVRDGLLAGVGVVASRILRIWMRLLLFFGLGLFGLYLLVKQVAPKSGLLQVLNNSLLTLVFLFG